MRILLTLWKQIRSAMKKQLCLLILATLLFSLSACSSYYYSMLNSNDPIGEKNEKGDFVQENDTVRISYRFWGENAPVTITIYNKSDEPIYVDWGRSALIIDDVVTSYDPKVASISGETSAVISGSSYSWDNRSASGWSYSEGSFSGDVALPKGVEFIPPRSKTVNTPLRLANFPFNEIPKDEYVKEQMITKAATTVNIRVKDFTPEDSPLKFRSYLTLFSGGTNGKELKHSSFERTFYVSKLIKVGDVAPQYFDEGQQQSGDFFYVRETRGAAAGLVVGAIAVTAAGVAIGATVGPVGF